MNQETIGNARRHSARDTQSTAPMHPEPLEGRVMMSLTPAAAPAGASGLPTGWTDSDVGAPALHGSATFGNGSWTIAGGGDDIWGAADQFNFASEPISGDGSIIARVDSIGNTGVWAKSGIMFRADGSAGSAFADVVATPAYGVNFQWRSMEGGVSKITLTAGFPSPVWLRLDRSGNNFSAFYAQNGLNWISIGSTQTVSMNTNALVGLAVTSHDIGNLSTSAFSNVAVSSPTTMTTLVSSRNPVDSRSAATFTATVSNISTTPLGEVQFLDGQTLLGEAPLIAGMASFSDSSLAIGPHRITANFLGAPGLATSASAVLTETVSPTGLVPHFDKLTMPLSLISGAKVKGTALISLTNIGDTSAAGACQATVYASPTSNFVQSTAIQIGSVSRTSHLKAGANMTLSVRLAAQSLPPGSYYILARAADALGNVNIVTAGATAIVRPALIGLSKQIVKVPAVLRRGKVAPLTLRLGNTGNVPINDAVQIALSLSSSPDGSSPAPWIALRRRISLKPGQNLSLSLSARLSPDLPAGSYWVVVAIPLPGGSSEDNQSNHVAVSTSAVSVIS